MVGARGRVPLKLVIVGAGAAGSMVAMQVAEESRRRRAPVELTLVDPGPPAGASRAFTTKDPRHLLNVPAGAMSCLHDRPGHFVHWLVRNRCPSATERSFVPRRHYGDYLSATLAACVERAGGPLTFRRLSGRAVACSVQGEHTRVRLADGTCLMADSVVIATGPLAGAAQWAPIELRKYERFIPDPWQPDALAGPLMDGDDVLLVGTGLSAVDVALAVDRPGRTVHALSRHGLLPRAHAVVPLPPVAPEEPLVGLPLRRLRSAVQRHVRLVQRAQGDWRPAVDGLRPLTSGLWSRLDEADRAEFLRHDRHLWDVHRHRMPPETAETVTRLRTAGRLRVRAGEVTAARDDGDALTVTVTGSREIRVGWVVDCTGPDLGPASSDDPLLRSLMDSGLARRGPLGIGLATTAEGRVRGHDGVVGSVWTLGAHRRGDLWETTAIPEVRQQAADLARALLHSSSPAARPARRAQGERPAPPPAPQGATVWLTGLPSAGKSTIAAEVAARLQSEGRRVEILDGDAVRTALSAGLGFSREDRDTHVRRVGMVAEVLARNGVIVLVPVIAPYRSSRETNRLRHDLARVPYVEIHVAAPVEVCAARDVKGLYARQAAGALSGLTGVDDPYEPPECPELRLETHRQTPTESADVVHALLAERGLV